jgi:hypothetical protein
MPQEFAISKILPRINTDLTDAGHRAKATLLYTELGKHCVMSTYVVSAGKDKPPAGTEWKKVRDVLRELHGGADECRFRTIDELLGTFESKHISVSEGIAATGVDPAPGVSWGIPRDIFAVRRVVAAGGESERDWVFMAGLNEGATTFVDDRSLSHSMAIDLSMLASFPDDSKNAKTAKMLREFLEDLFRPKRANGEAFGFPHTSVFQLDDFR